MDALRELLRSVLPRRNSYSRDVALTFGANLFTAGLSVVSGILLARSLGPVGRGELAAIQALPLILGSVGMLGLQDAIVYFGARDRKNIGEYGVSATALILLLGLPIVGLGVLLAPLFLRAHSPEIVFWSRIYLGVLFLNALMGFSVFTVRAVHDMPRWNFLRVLPQSVWVLVILSLVALGVASPHGIAMSYLVAFFLLSCVSLLAVRRYVRGQWRIRPGRWPSMLRYSLPLAAGSTPQVLGERTDQLIIAGMLPAQQLGYYAVAVSWSMLMLLPGAALFGVAFSKIAGMPEPAAQWRFTKKASLAVLAASVATGVVLVVTAPLVIPLAFGREFGASIPSATVLVLGAGLRNMARMFQVALKGCGRPGGIMFSEWGGVAVLLGAIFLLIPRYGLIGAAWSIVFSATASATIALVFLRRWSRTV